MYSTGQQHVLESMEFFFFSNMNWKEMDEAFPAFLVILAMPLTSSISTGIALGFISYPIVKAARGKWREIHPLVIVFAILFFIQLFIL
ncbi:hypothetical protein BHE18_00025 [Rossellomorea aquimaris]|uniref:Uncharacterized protein n=1 Tax=Rossellomorea aquimaris TaxID=189382 RepID=A0A1J6W886_9BACI|nr:hypothetical protein BHE18_00025 [Rossellomorea aquimaris]